MGKPKHPNTLRWMGKTGKKDKPDWKPHDGPFKVTKLPTFGEGSGITPPMTEEQLNEGVRIDPSWDW